MEKSIDQDKEYKKRLINYVVVNFDNVLGEEFKDVKKIRQLIKIMQEEEQRP